MTPPSARKTNKKPAAVQGAQPSSTFQLLINVKGRLSSVEEFEQIIVKVGAEGQISQLKDVAGSGLVPTYTLKSLLDNKVVRCFSGSGLLYSNLS
jgi:multidrug efflux pump